MNYYGYNGTTPNDLINYISNNNQPILFCDIETLKANTKMLGIKTSEVQSFMYCFIVAWEFCGQDFCLLLPNATVFFNLCLDALGFSPWKRKPTGEFHSNFNKLELHFFNGMKFDNHYILQDTLKRDFGCQEFPEWRMNNVHIEGEKMVKELQSNQVLTSRVRSSSSLQISSGYIRNKVGETRLTFIDDYPKFAMSLKACGKILNKKGLIPKDIMKTDGLKYDKFDVKEPLTYPQAVSYAMHVFDSFDPSELTYMFNDGLLLMNVVRYYNYIMGHDFHYSEMTATGNVRKAFTGRGEDYDNHIGFDLERQIREVTMQPNRKTGKMQKKTKIHHFKYSDYTFNQENLFDYFKHYYRGGMCIFNDLYSLRLLHFKWGSMDLNSSYPTVYYTRKLPLGNVLEWKEEECTEPIDYEMDKYTVFYQIDFYQFNELMQCIPSNYQKKGLIRYYNTASAYYYITSIGLAGIRDNCHAELPETITYHSKLVIENKYFEGREIARKMYLLKTTAKVMKDEGEDKHPVFVNNEPTNIMIVDGVTDLDITPEMVGMAKRCLNSLYGLPAINAWFKRCFVNENYELEIDHHGHQNKERNLLFSVSITAFALYNLWEPLRYLTPEQIDDAMLYQDTDSLYMKRYALDIIQQAKPELFHPYNLGAWDIEHYGDDFFISNHKKYAFTDDGTLHDGKNKGLGFRFGGCRKDSFDQTLDFETFVHTYMEVGCTVKNTRSLMNDELKPLIYDGVTKITEPCVYADEVNLDYILESVEDKIHVMKVVREHEERNDVAIDENGEEISGAMAYAEGKHGNYSSEVLSEKPKELTNKDMFDFYADFHDFEQRLKTLA